MKTSIKTIGLLAALAMGFTSPLFPVQAAEHFWDEIPLSPSTTRPSEVLDDYWNSEFQRVNREVAAAQNTRLYSPATQERVAVEAGRGVRTPAAGTECGVSSGA